MAWWGPIAGLRVNVKMKVLQRTNILQLPPTIDASPSILIFVNLIVSLKCIYVCTGQNFNKDELPVFKAQCFIIYCG